jgi:hypothetical protein
MKYTIAYFNDKGSAFMNGKLLQEKTKLNKYIKDYMLNNKKIFKSYRLLNGKISNFFWWRLLFSDEFKKKLKEEYKEYEGIHLMPYKVDNKLWKEILKKDVMNDSTLPNIDILSGNLHPILDDTFIDNWINNPTIKQIVLIKSNRDKSGKAHFGPGFDGNPNFNCYTLNDNLKWECLIDSLLENIIER